MRFAMPSVMQELTYPTMEKIIKKHPTLNKSFSTYRMKIITGKGIPLDYIINLPMKILNRITENSKQRLIRHRAGDITAALKAKKGEYRKSGSQMTLDEERAFVDD
jgi:hypothetical protein